MNLRPDGSGDEGDGSGAYQLMGSNLGNVVRLPSELGGAVEACSEEVLQACPKCETRSRKMILESCAVIACRTCMQFFWVRS